MAEFLPVFPRWNVWTVWQRESLSFDPLMVGVSRDRRLRIWVEDLLRLHGVNVADSLDLKGSQVEILREPPTDLAVRMRKEEVGGPAMVFDGDIELRTVRFFNRGGELQIPWGYDEDYLIEAVYTPSDKSPVTSGPAPSTVVDEITPSVSSPAGMLTIAALVAGGLFLLSNLRRR